MPVIIDGTNGITQAGEFNSDSSFGFKNRIINGAMVVSQRNGTSTVNPANADVTLDRWGSNMFPDASKYTVAQSTTAPTGFNNSLLVTSSSSYSIGATGIYTQFQWIEGFNTADLGWGTANAKTVTLSFWVRSSLTGTFGGALQNSDGTRNYPYSYTISVANTFEYKSVTIAGDTSGTWLTTNGRGIGIYFGLGVGSTYSGTAGAWSGSNFYSATGATSVVGTNGATFYVTGVQLEVGSTATSFDYRPYGTELALCQRYYQAFFGPVLAGVGNGTTNVNDVVIPLFVPLRASPTMGSCNGAAFTSSAYNSFTSVTPTVVLNSSVFISTNQLRLNFGSVSGVTDNRIAGIRVDTNLSISSEL